MLRVGPDELHLLAGELAELAEGAASWSAELRRQSGAVRGQHLRSLETSLQVSALVEELIAAPGGLSDPPVQLGDGEAQLLRRLLAEMVSYQRRTLTPGLREFKARLDAASTRPDPRQS